MHQKRIGRFEPASLLGSALHDFLTNDYNAPAHEIEPSQFAQFDDYVRKLSEAVRSEPVLCSGMGALLCTAIDACPRMVRTPPLSFVQSVLTHTYIHSYTHIHMHKHTYAYIHLHTHTALLTD